MVQVTSFLLVLSLALVAPGFSERKWELEGHWINGMGHLLIIGPVDQQGRFNGTYIVDKPYTLKGFQHSMNQNSQILELELEFTVYWSSDKKTIFKRNSFLNYWGNKVLKTTWFLMSHKHRWITIRSGTYYFGRLCTCKKDCPGVDFNAEGSTWDTNPISCSTTGLHSQEKFGSFETGEGDWDADPISGSTTCF
ncbi:avidin-like [Columba livia]|uniref:avidin-like n=1 Tax=Columba livia TaxID=8932 RepID=UPI0031B9EB68